MSHSAIGRIMGACRSAAPLLIILVLAGVLRGVHFTQPLVDAFSWRESSTAMMADNFQQRNWNIFFPEVSWTGPGPSYQGREFQVVSYITALLYAAFGWHDWFGRAVAIAFGLWGVFALHRLIETLSDRTHANAGALMLAIAPGAIMIDRSFLPDPAMAALATTGLWLFVAYLRTSRPWLLALSALVTALAVLAKLPGVTVLAPIAYAAVAIRGDRGMDERRVPLLLLALAVVIAPVAAYYAWALHLGTSYPPYHVAGSGYAWEDPVGMIRHGFFLKAAAEHVQQWFLTLPMLALVGLGALVPFSRGSGEQRPARWIFHVWIGAGVLLFLVAAEEFKNNPWNLHYFSPPAAALAGAGLVWASRLGGTERPSLAGYARAAFLVAIVIWAGALSLGFMRAPYAQNGYEMGRRLYALSRPGDLVVTAAPSIGDPVAIYYSRRRGWVFPIGGGSRVWHRLLDDGPARDELEMLRRQGADWFAAAKDARDSEGRMLIEHNRGLIAHLDRSAVKVVDDDRMLIYRLTPPDGR